MLEQCIDPGADRFVDDKEVQPEQEHSNDDDGSRGLYFFEGGIVHLLHFGADVVVESLDPVGPGFHRCHQFMFSHRCHPLSTFRSYFRTCSSKILAGAEGFEPPSSVLETDSLTVELTPLYQKLFHFLVRRVLPASRTELLKLQPLRRRLAVLGRRIIPLFTIRTLQLTNLAWHRKTPNSLQKFNSQKSLSS